MTRVEVVEAVGREMCGWVADTIPNLDVLPRDEARIAYALKKLNQFRRIHSKLTNLGYEVYYPLSLKIAEVFLNRPI